MGGIDSYFIFFAIAAFLGGKMSWVSKTISFGYLSTIVLSILTIFKKFLLNFFILFLRSCKKHCVMGWAESTVKIMDKMSF